MQPLLPRTRAFTLVEILVVMAIILVLAAILFPVMNTMRERGRVTVCTNNLKQLGMAMQLYVEDNGKYPYSYAPTIVQPSRQHPGMGWARRIESYVKDTAVHRCPSANYIREPVSYTDGTVIPNDYLGYTTYDLNIYASGISPGQIKDSSRMMVLGDGFSNLSWASTHYFRTEDDATYHWGGINYWFADGHVKLLNKEQTWWHCKQPAGSGGDRFSACPGG